MFKISGYVELTTVDEDWAVRVPGAPCIRNCLVGRRTYGNLSIPALRKSDSLWNYLPNFRGSRPVALWGEVGDLWALLVF